MSNTYYAGIDIGSTTVKLVILDDSRNILFAKYRRHLAHIQQAVADLLSEARAKLGSIHLRPKVTGSGSINLAKHLQIGFVQEVVAVASALEAEAPQTDVAIELGGEDAKIIYFTGGLEQRMNGVCAGGTGSFIDQMASLLQTDAAGLNEYAKNYKEIYPIAARCGVFAKSDIQPLINEGATMEDLSASIFQAVVNQTISGLACGKPITGHVAFLGGPLHFLTELKKAFIRTLKLTPDMVVDPENSHLFAALGAAMAAADPVENEDAADFIIDHLIDRLQDGVEMDFELKRLPALFESQEEYDKFKARHAGHKVEKKPLESYSGNCFLGIDAGSTTTKLALIGENGELLWSFYSNNNGSPVKTSIAAIGELAKKLPKKAKICRSCSTGYGETLLKSAFQLEEGEVETIAHYYAAAFFDPEVDCVLDIGGQDMKCIKMKNHSVDHIMLNESCSSGCGSFLENFAGSLGYTAAQFAQKALFAKNPIDLGTRCTVFMNSNVKQAQKEGATVEDISAGLAYSVIKNALFKVIKLTDISELGSHIIVQGGTFYNEAVLRALEKITDAKVICPDISGLMGAFGAALIAKERYQGQKSTILPFDQIENLSYTTKTARCKGCSNRCMLTINQFDEKRRYISGNRCEKAFGAAKEKKEVPNLVAYKLKRLFDYPVLANPTRGTIGIPRTLNLYENYPYWATFFAELGFAVKLSPLSSRKIYECGMDSIPSESECYPAKLAHGHVQWLINEGVTTIFYPSVFYEHKEEEAAQNNFNCPMVIAYPENIKNNVEDIAAGKVKFLHPFISFGSEKVAEKRLVSFCKEEFGIGEKEVRAAAQKAWQEMRRAKDDVRKQGSKAMEWMKAHGAKGIVLAGRPYHIDPEINHGIPELITSYGMAVLTEDSLPLDMPMQLPLRVNDQWVYHSRLYRAAEYVSKHEDLELIQLNSFGCGLDAVTTDQVAEILETNNKLYTVLKIDEVNNLGAARIRVRSLIAAMNLRDSHHIHAKDNFHGFHRAEFTKQMYKDGWTILAPQMAPFHFDLLQPLFARFGYNLVLLDNDNRAAIDVGLKFVNNDACYPSTIMVGQIMEAVTSGRYDTDHLAVMMSQTGGGCRASNYVGFIRRALGKAGYSHIPVISLNLNKMETNPGFKITLPMLIAAVKAVVYGDLMMRCVYRVRPYELTPGSANALHQKWKQRCIDSLNRAHSTIREFTENCRKMVKDFDNLPIQKGVTKPKVGIVGEILVKYMPLANNHLVDLLEREGAEVVVPDLLDFFAYGGYNGKFKHEYLGAGKMTEVSGRALINIIDWVRKPAADALRDSKRFSAPVPIDRIAALAEPFISTGNQYGEGWFLTGEMLELVNTGVNNIICIQPFACLPNHVVGKGVIKAIRKQYPNANIVAVDYDPGASEVNQLNRIKLMLSTAMKVHRETVEEKQAVPV